MDEGKRESIFRMVADGTITTDEAARMLARLKEEELAIGGAKAEVDAREKKAKSEKSKSDKQQTDEEERPQRPFAIKGADGKDKIIELPDGLVQQVSRLIAEQVKEHSIRVARETATGAKNLVLNKFDELRDGVKSKLQGGGKREETPAPPAPTAEELRRADARRRILGMVQNGQITALDAGKLIRELDALEAFEKRDDEPKDDGSAKGSKGRR